MSLTIKHDLTLDFEGEPSRDFGVTAQVDPYCPPVIRMDPDNSRDAEGGEVEIIGVVEYHTHDCSNCYGRGTVRSPRSHRQEKCPYCHGRKTVTQASPVATAYFEELWVKAMTGGKDSLYSTLYDAAIQVAEDRYEEAEARKADWRDYRY